MDLKNPSRTIHVYKGLGGERPIPPEFIAAMDRAEDHTPVPNDTVLPTFPSDILVEAHFETNKLGEKVLVTISKKAGVIGPLMDIRTTDQGVAVQVAKTMFRTADTSFVKAKPSATQDVAMHDLGNGWTIQEVGIQGYYDSTGTFVPAIYQGVELTTRKDDPMPSQLRTGKTERTVQSVVEGTVAQPTIGDNDLSASERQIAQHQKLLSRLTRDDVTLPAPEKYEVSIEDLLPPRFRGLAQATRSSMFVAGTASLPTLGPGDLIKSEQQVTALVKLVEALSRAGVEFPIEVVDTATLAEPYGGGKVNINSFIDVNDSTDPRMTLEEGENIVSSKRTKLGEGHELRETVKRQDAHWPDRYFGTYVPRLKAFITGVKRVVGLGTTTAQVIPSGPDAGKIQEVRDVDGYREERIITTHPYSEIDAYVRKIYGNNTNVDVPPQLSTLTAYVDLSVAGGAYDEGGVYSISAPGVGSLNSRCNAEANATAIQELGWDILFPRTSNIPCVHVLFYAPIGSDRGQIITLLNSLTGWSVADWPMFWPKPIVVLLKGGKASINAQASISRHDSIVVDYLGVNKYNGYSTINGHGSSGDVVRNSKVITIPPTIHGSIGIGIFDDPVNHTAEAIEAVSHAAINIGNLPVAETGNIGAIAGSSHQILSGAAGTKQAQTIPPGSGTVGTWTVPSHVHRFVTEVDSEFDRLRVLAELVNFVDIVP